MGLDANGIYVYTGAEDAAPPKTLLNLLGASVSPTVIGPWTSYTPILSAGTGSWFLGTTGAVNSCVWRRERDLIRVRYKFILGAGFTFPTARPRFTLPVAAATPQHGSAVYNGVGSIRDTVTSGAQYLTHCVVADGTSTTVAEIILGDAPIGTPALTPTSPFTWAALHALQGEFTYRPAA